jgi:hypothetical protein
VGKLGVLLCVYVLSLFEVIADSLEQKVKLVIDRFYIHNAFCDIRVELLGKGLWNSVD